MLLNVAMFKQQRIGHLVEAILIVHPCNFDIIEFWRVQTTQH